MFLPSFLGYHLKIKLGTLLLIAMGGLAFLIRGFLSAGSIKHDFTGKCQLCHIEIPEPGTPFEKVTLTDDVQSLCVRCHKINERTSHPTGVQPRTSTAMQRYLDKEGKLTCVTCHDVHKEQNSSFTKQELKGLLRGHAQGRAFCFTCHNDEMLGANWRHRLVISYAHAPGQLSQMERGSPLDKYSLECLSCHDGVISKMTPVEVKAGSFQHGIGLSHPVGVKYPLMGRDSDFAPRDTLPEEIQLFDGAVGCLSCHNPYGNKKHLLVMDNVRSALCLTCHRK